MDFGFAAVPLAFAIGYYIVPPVTDRILAFKYREINATWDESLQAYENHLRFTRRKPLLDSERYERSMAQWGNRQAALARARKLSFEKVLALRMVGIVPNPPEGHDPTRGLPREREVEASYRLPFTTATRLGCGVLLALAAIFLAFSDLPVIGIAAGIAAGALMEITYLCDMQARIIPYQVCFGFGAAAVVFSLATGGLHGLAVSALVALAMSIMLQAANMVMSHLSGSPAIGSGDLRFIPMICLFSGFLGTLFGFVGASIVMALIALFVVVAKDGNRKSYVPYAPGLSCWYAIGLLTQVFCV